MNRPVDDNPPPVSSLETPVPPSAQHDGRAIVLTRPDAAELETSYRACAAVTQAEATNFYYTFWLLPAERRRSIYAIYAFSRKLDDLVDDTLDNQVDTPVSGDARTQTHKDLDRMARLVDGQESEHEFSAALQDTIDKFSIPRAHFHELIEGMRMDLDGQEYRSFDDLYLYCYRAASTIGLICIEIFGRSREGIALLNKQSENESTIGTDAPGTTEPGKNLGIAMQLTNIIRDVAEDLRRGRVYLPEDELRQFDVSRETLGRSQPTDGLRELMKFQVERARKYFQDSEPLFPLLRASSRFCPILLRRFYSELLDRVEESNYDVLGHRPKISSSRKARIAAGVWLRSLLVRLAD